MTLRYFIRTLIWARLTNCEFRLDHVSFGTLVLGLGLTVSGTTHYLSIALMVTLLGCASLNILFTTPVRVISPKSAQKWEGTASPNYVVRPPATDSKRALTPSNKSSKQVLILCWDVNHNAVGRARMLAQILGRHYSVTIAGPSLERFGSGVWAPMKFWGPAIVALPELPLADYVRRTAQITGFDLVICSKPRLTSLVPALQISQQESIPMILDIDDNELGFRSIRRSLRSALVAEAPRETDPNSNEGIEEAHRLIETIQHRWVSNSVLQSKFGGMLVPHARDENTFYFSQKLRTDIRRRLGLSGSAKLITFGGTVRAHKGVEELATSLRELNNREIYLGLFEAEDSTAFKRIKRILGNRLLSFGAPSIDEIPGILSATDLVCLLQDIKSEISRYQLPAKFVDALAIGIPILATPVGPMKELIDRGLAEPTSLKTLKHDISRLMESPVSKDQRKSRREVFLAEYSFGSVGSRLIESIAGIEKTQMPTKGAVPAVPHSDTKPTQTRHSKKNSGTLHLIFLWKQNDAGLYGRRVEMLAKHLSERPEVSHIDFIEPRVASSTLEDWQATGLMDQRWWLVPEIYRKSWGFADSPNLRFHAAISKAGLESKEGEARILSREIQDLRSHSAERGLETVLVIFPYNPIVSELLPLVPGVPIIADFIDDNRNWHAEKSVTSKAIEKQYKTLLTESIACTTNSSTLAGRLGTLGRRPTVIPNASHYVLKTSGHPPNDRRFSRFQALPGTIAGYVGNLETDKLDVRLLEKVSSSFPDLSIVVIGSHHNRPDLGNLPKQRNVHFVGVVPFSELSYWLDRFDFAIVPHLNNSKNQAMDTLKHSVFQSVGLPIIASGPSSRHESNPLFFHAKTHQEMLSTIRRFLRGDLSKAHRQTSPDTIGSSWDEVARKFLLHVTKSLDARYSDNR